MRRMRMLLSHLPHYGFNHRATPLTCDRLIGITGGRYPIWSECSGCLNHGNQNGKQICYVQRIFFVNVSDLFNGSERTKI